MALEQGHNNLLVWKKSKELCLLVYKVTKTFPSDERFSLVDQMRRASISIPSNIAEGKSRGTRKDYRQFIFIARGSCAELETQFEIAKDLGYLTKDQTLIVLEQIHETGKMLTGLIKALSD